MKKIILDTNFAMIPATLGVDIFTKIKEKISEPYEIYVIDKTIDELEKIIREQKGKHKEAAKLTLKLLKDRTLSELDTKSLNITGNSKDLIVDDIIVEISDKNTIVATQDKDLKKRLREKNIKTLILRNKKKVEII